MLCVALDWMKKPESAEEYPANAILSGQHI
jgi:hypothetical protein